MNVRQLELDLDLALESAAESPVLANLRDLWQQFEPVLAQLSVQEQLRLGSQVIERLAGIHQAKANFLFENWENTYDPQDPNLPGDWLQGLVRHTQHVDFSELTAPAQRRPRSKDSKPELSQDLVVGEVPKADLLQLLDTVEAESQKAAALAVAHEERIQDWVAEIHQWFELSPQPILLLELQQQLSWPLVQLWLSLLLGGFQLEATDPQFYSACIVVFPPSV